MSQLPRTDAPGASGAPDSSPFIVLACTRSGSQMFVSGLDSHPQIYCERQESLGRRHPLIKYSVPRTLAARLAMTQRGYKVSGCKVTASQLLDVPGVGGLFAELKPKVIWLERKNKVRRAVSSALRGHPVDGTVRLDLNAVVDRYRVHAERERAALAWLDRSGLDRVDVTYEEILDGHDEVDFFPRAVSNRLTDFLGVEHRRLEVSLRRFQGHSQPLHQLVENWDEVKDALTKEGFVEGLGGDEV